MCIRIRLLLRLRFRLLLCDSFAALRFHAISFSVNPNSPTALALGFQSLKEKATYFNFCAMAPKVFYGTIPIAIPINIRLRVRFQLRLRVRVRLCFC